MQFHDVQVISRAQVASLAFLIYDICITLDDEVGTIWSKPNNSWIKWQFLFTRYFALVAQAANRTIESIATNRKSTIGPGLRKWYMCQVLFGAILMSAVEVVLMARVYALYNKNKWIRLAFFVLIVAEIATVVAGIIVNVPGEDFGLYEFLVFNPRSYTYFGICAMVSQLTIIGLTLAKYKAAIRGGWQKVPIMMLMVRDGTVAFFILLVITTITVVGTNKQNQFAPIGGSWFLSIVACAGCRLIINMQNLPTRSELLTANRPQATIQLTTVWTGFEEPHECYTSRTDDDSVIPYVLRGDDKCLPR